MPGFDAVSPLGLRGMQVLIGGRDLTSRCDTLVFSSTDHGGFEICTLGLPASDRPTKGSTVIIRQGLEVAWYGRVAELADHSAHAHATRSIGCEGARALLKDDPMQMIYVDRELGQWKPASRARQIAMLAISYNMNGAPVAADVSTGLPALIPQFTGAWAAPDKPVSEAWYDAGAGNLVSSLYYDVVPGAGVSETFQLLLGMESADTGEGGLGQNTGNLAGKSTSGTFSPATPARWAFWQFLFGSTPQGVQGHTYFEAIRNLALYGNHGLTKRGPDPGGFYPSDIARHALAQTRGIDVGTIIDATSYIVPQAVYRTATDPDMIIADMAKLMGWTWGVWEPSTIFSERPRLDFRPPPPDATAVVSKAECDELDITTRLGDLYDSAIVTYTDAAGSVGQVEVELANPQLQEAGISGRTLTLPGGLLAEAEARTLGLFALALSQVSARGAGQATLPSYAKLPGGGSKPATLLRPGIDRLRITDLISAGSLTDIGTNRRDVFRISRAETTVGRDGVASTRVELDTGVNLLEVLQARQALAAGVVGSG
jgi:hypothetical protein